MSELASFLSEYGIDSIFLIQTDKVSEKILKSVNHKVFTFTKKSDLPKTLAVIWEKHIITLVINDTLSTKDADLRALRSPKNVPIITFDDTGDGLTEANAVINSIVYSWNRYTISPKMNNIFEGPQYLIIQESIKKYAKIKRDFSLKRISISIGGTDTQNISYRLIKALEPLLSDIKIDLIMGPGTIIPKPLKQLQNTFSDHLLVHQAPKDLFKIISRSSLLICAGGMTLFEAMAIGQPCAPIACEEHEIFNIASQDNHVINLGFYKDLKFDHLVMTIKKQLSSPHKLKEMSKISQQKIDFNGKEKILEIIKNWLPK